MTQIRPDDLQQVVLQNGDMRVQLLNLGAITQSWQLQDTPLILGYSDIKAYLRDPYYHGAIAGRVANRIKGAAYQRGGKRFVLSPNDACNQLHGGPDGLAKVVWDITEQSDTSVMFSHLSPHGSNGFPGAVRFEVTVTLKAPHLTYDMRAMPDRETPISIAQHSYYSLGQRGGIDALKLHVAGTHRLAKDHENVPDGRILPVANTDLDYRALRPVGPDLDDFFVFDPARVRQEPVAECRSTGGLRLRIWSDQPGAQIYSGGGLGGSFSPGGGLAIEPSGYPNAVNQADFPSVFYTPERPYRQVLTLEVTPTA